MTKDIFRENSFLKTCKAKVTKVTDDGFVTDQSIFYPAGGGQLGDTGTVDGVAISNTVKGEGSEIVHVVEAGSFLAAVGDEVELTLNWERRYKHMQMHTALHLLCSLIDAPVTGGSIGAEKSRLDFDLEAAPDKELVSTQLQELIDGDYAVLASSISDAELDANPDLVRTMSVKPPRGSGHIRMVRIGNDERQVDYQPCGGTHVKTTAEIGKVRVSKIEKKGKQNRRISIVFAD